MSHEWMLVPPGTVPPLDPGFRPAALACQAFHDAVDAAGGGERLVLGLERSNGAVSRFETRVFPDGHEKAGANGFYVERLLKFLMWQKGACKVYVGGPASVGAYIADCYRDGGLRSFDFHFMGEDVYETPFTVVCCTPEAVPAENEQAQALGRHLEGCRIGFDLGASDRKVSAVVDGEAIFSEEVVWEPRKQNDPAYH